MSIKFYTGRPGSGKSYNSVANVIIPALRSGRTVVTNVPLNKREIYTDFPDADLHFIPFSITHNDVEKYFSLDKFPSGSVFVIDEAGKLFPIGSKVLNIDPELLRFFTEHRHSVGSDGYASEIFLLSQDATQVAKYIRDLVDTTYHHVKLDKHGLKNHFRVDIYDGSVSGASSRATPVSCANGFYSESIFKYYKSHTHKSPDADTALEISPDKRGSHLKFYLYASIAAPLSIILAYYAYTVLIGTFGSSSDLDSTQPSTTQIKPPDQNISEPSNTITTPPGRQDSLTRSTDWRLSGVITTSRGVDIIVDGPTRSRVLNGLKHCSYDMDISEWQCVLNGQIVASYTGKAWDPDSKNSILPFD